MVKIACSAEKIYSNLSFNDQKVILNLSFANAMIAEIYTAIIYLTYYFFSVTIYPN